MPKRTVLIADNSQEFRATCAEFLREFDYEVIEADTPEECLEQLETGNVHVAVLDIRMREDTDERDWSGLQIARTSDPVISKIVLTGYPTWEAVRGVLTISEPEGQPAFRFLAKAEGVGALFKAVEEAFEQHVRINWQLQIDWAAWESHALANLLEVGLNADLLHRRAAEIEDLLRRLFARAERLKLERLLWQRGPRLALAVSVFAEGKAPETMLVVCGQRHALRTEFRQYQKHAHTAPRASATLLQSSQPTETLHFGALAYGLAGCRLAETLNLKEFYRSDSGKAAKFNKVVTTLCTQTLTDWTQDKRLLFDEAFDTGEKQPSTLAEFYRSRLGLDDTMQTLDEQINQLLLRLPLLKTRATRRDQQIHWRFQRAEFAYPDPAAFFTGACGVESSLLLTNSPGLLTGENVLVGADEQAWLTDFVEAGSAPLLWHYTTLEAAIRFDWLETEDLLLRLALEQFLVEEDFSNFRPSESAAELRKALYAIQQIRELAVREMEQDYTAYHLGLGFHVAQRLLRLQPEDWSLTKPLAQAAHALLALGLIADGLHKTVGRAPVPANSELAFDPQTGEVSVGERRWRLRGQKFELMKCLYARANRECPRSELIAEVFPHLKLSDVTVQENNINMAIRRLREELGDPRYLLTERGSGYLLRTNLKDLPGAL